MHQLRWIRLTLISASFACAAFCFASTGRTAHIKPKHETSRVPAAESLPSTIIDYHRSTGSIENPNDSAAGGIREQIPDKCAAHYQHWKQEFLATETGRQQWASYQNNPNFTLTILITRENPEGGNTGNYQWNADGKLVAATITLGCKLDQGLPDPVYFPVLSSLEEPEAARSIDRETVAATKIAHEFGHVNQTARGDAALYQLQLQLMPQYNRIFLTNGRNSNDPRLLELARTMGATPVEIWEDREYWGETNAMLFLRDRFADDGVRCLLFSRIKHSVDMYAPSYEARFLNVAQSIPSGPRCGW